MSSRSGDLKKLVVVESPTKARTIRKFLGKDYIVESCMGHVRDLPQSAKDIPADVKKEHWAHLGVNVDDGFKPVYCVPKNKIKIVKELKDKLKEASELILATDEDREGESISWHLVELLKPKVPTKRMVFHEITKEAILKAIGEYREIDQNLVRAQEARRILDRLVGYTISPLLWKKVAYGLSAGRVQSVAVRLIVEKEIERLKFIKAVYWGVTATLSKDGVEFEARLTGVKDKKVATGKDFDPDSGALSAIRTKDTVVLDQKTSGLIATNAKSDVWTVTDIEQKPISRKPSPPFITSTLQQESNRKLGLSARETMEVAQKLYENGFITYMRTDSTFLSQQAIEAARTAVKEKFGKEYVPEQPRLYEGKKVKGAQEAHESIRPAGSRFVAPEETGLSGIQYKLYELIWKRTVACQMKNSEQNQTRVLINCGEGEYSASGLVIEFEGYLKAYNVEVSDDQSDKEDSDGQLPDLKVKETLKAKDVTSKEHETKPPARFTEASLVQTMEKEGIGRPSTYASIISTILNRGYAKKNGPALVPTFTAIVVTQLLSRYLPDYVDTKFTSQMETSLDDIADGDREWVEYLTSVYSGKKGLRSTVEQQEKEIDVETSRSVNLPGFKGLDFKVGRYGAYVCRVDKNTGEEVCASIPESMSAGDMSTEKANQLIDQKIKGADALGVDPVTNEKVYVLSGRYGPYVQLGEVTDEDKKIKRMSIPPHIAPETITMEQALNLLSLPKTIGLHPDDKKDVKVGIGRFGPYILYNGEFRSIPKTEDFFSLPLAKALEILAQPKKGRGRATVLKELGAHPSTKEDISILSGKYGPYIKSGKVNASLPEGTKVEEFTLAAAVDLITEKIGKDAAKGKVSSKSPKKTKPAAKPETKVKAAVAKKTAVKANAKVTAKPIIKSVAKPVAKTSLKPPTKVIAKTVTPTVKTVPKPAPKIFAKVTAKPVTKANSTKSDAKSVKPIISRTVTIKKTSKTT
jgi:DNA topoisomerase-1